MNWRGRRIYLVGIKGTGMAALAELLLSRGAEVSGSDTTDRFYTDDILRELGIPFREGFRTENLPASADLVVHSAAYDRADHPELKEAVRRGVPLMTYPEALGEASRETDASGIAGVHGKTTTTGIAGTLADALGLPVQVVAGSAVASFGGRSTLIRGDRFLIAETCEYRRHFLAFRPDRIVLTSVEPDHLDYFSGYDDIRDAFLEYGRLLPSGGALIYCSDDPGARDVAGRLRAERPDIRFVPYGETADGPFRIEDIRTGEGRSLFTLRGLPGELAVRIPGRHTVRNAAAAVALVSLIREAGRDGGGDALPADWSPDELERLRDGLLRFTGSRRRSEIVGEAGGILFMDDYAHHPTAIRTTLEGLRAFYPGRRIVADFMSHTYSRTKALLEDFASAFAAADAVVLHGIYASAREADPGDIGGLDLYRKAAERHREVHYFEQPIDALPWCRETLRSGDLFVTMGAGDNWKLGKELYGALTAAGAAAGNGGG